MIEIHYILVKDILLIIVLVLAVVSVPQNNFHVEVTPFPPGPLPLGKLRTPDLSGRRASGIEAENLQLRRLMHSG